MTPPKLKLYTKICKKCNNRYNSESKNSKVCSNCDARGKYGFIKTKNIK